MHETEKQFGSGWISGTLSIFCGMIALGAVLAFHFPAYLTMPEFRAQYPLDFFRFLIGALITLSFALGGISIFLRQKKWLGLAGMTMALAAHLLGGADVKPGGLIETPFYLGLDAFLLSLLYFSVVFVPLERWKPVHVHPVLRMGWKTDFAHFFANHILSRVILFLTFLPATLFFSWTTRTGLQLSVSAQPAWLQFFEAYLISDFVTYWIHRGFHTRFLWPFHAVHHSVRVMDWLAGSRLHLVEIVLLRSLTFIPLYALGFSMPVIVAYIAFISVLAVFIHANLRFEFGPMRWLVATPAFHHWHHSDDPDVLNRNFSVHGPLMDRLFGTLHFPKGKWPASYGIRDRHVPEGYIASQMYPFKKHL